LLVVTGTGVAKLAVLEIGIRVGEITSVAGRGVKEAGKIEGGLGLSD
jgi:hypothetical protein